MLNFLPVNAHYRFWKPALSVSVISLCLNFPVLSQTEIINDSEINLAPQEQVDLNQGKVVLKGEKGQYIGEVIATGKVEQAWEVLTDYDGFQNFLPNISSSKIIKENGKIKIFEQVNLVDLWLLTKQFTVQIAATENYPQKINFEIVEGDLERLQGSWEIKELSNNQILITHRVIVAPKSKSEEAIFYGIYETSLEETLTAIALEIEKRSHNVL